MNEHKKQGDLHIVHECHQQLYAAAINDEQMVESGWRSPVTGLRTLRTLGSDDNKVVAMRRMVRACSSVSLPSRRKWSRINSELGFRRPCESFMKSCSSVGLNAAGSGTCRSGGQCMQVQKDDWRTLLTCLSRVLTGRSGDAGRW